MGNRARKLLGIGGLFQSIRKHKDPEINRIIDDVYDSITKLAQGSNLKSGFTGSQHNEGKSGDVRLFKGTGYDGSTGYFLQGRFEDGWGTVKLAFDSKNPTSTDMGGNMAFGAGGTTGPSKM